MIEHEIKFGETTVQIPKREFDNCRHRVVDFCQKLQLLKCTTCGEFLTPWWFLQHHVSHFRCVAEEVNQMREIIKLKERILEGLRRDEINVKNRIRTAQRKLDKLEKDATNPGPAHSRQRH